MRLSETHPRISVFICKKRKNQSWERLFGVRVFLWCDALLPMEPEARSASGWLAPEDDCRPLLQRSWALGILYVAEVDSILQFEGRFLFRLWNDLYGTGAVRLVDRWWSPTQPLD